MRRSTNKSVLVESCLERVYARSFHHPQAGSNVISCSRAIGSISPFLSEGPSRSQASRSFSEAAGWGNLAILWQEQLHRSLAGCGKTPTTPQRPQNPTEPQRKLRREPLCASTSPPCFCGVILGFFISLLEMSARDAWRSRLRGDPPRRGRAVRWDNGGRVSLGWAQRATTK